MEATLPSILITDDDSALRETLGGVFEPQGFRVLLAADGEEAVHIVRGQQVHLLLLDMHMPKLTGLETIRAVKQFKAGLPCILMSAEADEVLVRQARLVQAFSVLFKPVTRRIVVKTVHAAMRGTYGWSHEPGESPEGGPSDGQRSDEKPR